MRRPTPVRPFRHAALLVGAAAALAAACSHDSMTDPNAPMGLALSLSPRSDTIYVADTLTDADRLQLTLSATASGGLATPTPKGVEWTTSNPDVAAVVDGSGVVAARGVGVATITARVNDERAKATVVVAYRATHIDVSPSAVIGLAGDTVVLTARAMDDGGKAVPGTAYGFGVSESAVAAMERIDNQKARVVFLKAGATMVNVSAAGRVVTLPGSAMPRDFVGGTPGGPAGPLGALTFVAGPDVTCGLLPLGRAYCFGRGDGLGIARDTSCFNDVPNDRHPCTLIPLPIAPKLDLVSLSMSDNLACAAASDGKAYCWGSDIFGQLGNGGAIAGTSLQPSLVVGAVTRSAFYLTRISAGGYHACGLTPTGAAFCWGQDSLYQLGNGEKFRVNATTPIPVFGGQTFATISAGGTHSCAVQPDGAAFCWGDNRHGQLGTGAAVAVGDTSDRPVAVAGGITFASVTAGPDDTCGLTAPGVAYCWGSDAAGKLGRGVGSGDAGAPVPVAGGHTFRSISLGPTTTCGITTGGEAYCWGSNDYGQLGDGIGRGGPSAAPQRVVGGRTDFTAVAVGRRHVCAISPGGAYCWGSNVFGALGNELQAMIQPAPEKTAPPQ